VGVCVSVGLAVGDGVSVGVGVTVGGSVRVGVGDTVGDSVEVCVGLAARKGNPNRKPCVQPANRWHTETKLKDSNPSSSIAAMMLSSLLRRTQLSI